VRIGRWLPLLALLGELAAPGVAWGALPPLLAPECTLGPQVAPDVVASLGYADDHWQATGGARVSDIRIDAGAIRFVPAAGQPEHLVATHLRNLPADAPVPAWTGATLAVFVREGADPSWTAAAAEAGQRLDGLAWSCAASTAPPLSSGLPWLAWGVLLTAAGLALHAASGPLSRLTRRQLLGLLLLLIVALGARTLRWSPHPLHYIEIERVPPAPKPGSEELAALAMPLLSLTSDGVAAQAGLNVALGSLAPLLLVALGSAWVGRGAGWLAGLLLAVAPLQLRFGGSSDASVTFTPLLLGAMVALEVALATGQRAALLAAGLLWGLAMPLRPDAPIYLLALGAWLLVDARGRSLLRAPLRASLLLLPLAAGLAAALPGLAARGRMPLLEHPADALPRLGLAAWSAAQDLAFDPRLRPPLEAALALGGALVTRGPARWMALLAGLVLPALAFGLQGTGAFGGTPLDLEEAKSALYGQPFWLLAAASLLTSATRLRPRWHVASIPLAALGLVALLAAWWGCRDTVRRISPVQAEHAFLAERLPRLPPRAVLVIEGRAEGFNAPVHVEHRVVESGRPLLASPGRLRDEEGVVVLPAGSDLSAIPPGVPVFALRGWLAWLDPREASAPPPSGADCQTVPTSLHPATGATSMPLCLAPMRR